MKLQSIYMRAAEMAKAYYTCLGLRGEDLPDRLKSSPRLIDLDRWPVVIRPQGVGLPWRVSYEYKADAGSEWMDFEIGVRNATMAALAAHPNLKELSRTSGVQYATLWRAKDGRAITKGIIELMGQTPDVVFWGLHGVIPDGVPVPAMTREQAWGIPVRAMG